MTALLALMTGLAQAQTVEQPGTWQEHEQIDAQMGVLQGPVWQPVWFTREDAPGRPAISPIYKQQPPGAQGDFRPRPAPPAVVPVTIRPDPRPDSDPEPDEPDDDTGTQKPDPVSEPDEPLNCPIIFVTPCF